MTIETLLKTINETIDNKNPYLKIRLIKDDLNEIKIKEDKREVVRFVEPYPRKRIGRVLSFGITISILLML